MHPQIQCGVIRIRKKTDMNSVFSFFFFNKSAEKEKLVRTRRKLIEYRVKK